MNSTIVKIAAVLGLTYAVAGCQEAKVQFKARVTDDAGVPIEKCEVVGTFFDHWQKGEGFGKDIYRRQKALTDALGAATISSSTSQGEIFYSATASSGYYKTHRAGFIYRDKDGGRWMPADKQFEIVLKRKLNPIAMYARRVGMGAKVEVPELGKDAGFDLIVSDWVAPHGKGSTADLIFRLEQRYVSTADFDSSLTVRFANNGDGLIKAPQPVGKGSELRLDHQAPTEGYQPEMVWKTSATPPAGTISVADNPDMNYYFRVRTVVDEKGRVKSALYGKIYGDIRFSFTEDRQILFNYYLNPLPNSRNLEFNPAKNLLPNLNDLETVDEP